LVVNAITLLHVHQKSCQCLDFLLLLSCFSNGVSSHLWGSPGATLPRVDVLSDHCPGTLSHRNGSQCRASTSRFSVRLSHMLCLTETFTRHRATPRRFVTRSQATPFKAVLTSKGSTRRLNAFAITRLSSMRLAGLSSTLTVACTGII